MNKWHILIGICFLGVCFQSLQNLEPISGILFLSDEKHLKHDLFLPIEIDTTLSLEENIRTAKLGVPKRVNFYSKVDLEILKSHSILAEDVRVNNSISSIQIVAAKVQFGRWRVRSVGIGELDSLSCQLSLKGKLLFSWYDERNKDMIMSAEEVKIK